MKALISSHLYPINSFLDLSSWKKNIEEKIKISKSQNADIILFPEYGSLDLLSLSLKTTNPLAEKIDSEILKEQLPLIQNFSPIFREHFSSLAKTYKVYIVAPSFPFQIEADLNKYVNRCFVYNPSGDENYQDKLIMTRFENEQWHISPADKILKVFNSAFGRWSIQICYDSEFPIPSLLLAKAGVDFILAPSCTETAAGATRVHVSCQARAIENQIYTVVSQTINDCSWNPAVDKNYGYAGFYSPADYGFPETGVLFKSPPQTEQAFTFALDIDQIRNIRSQGQVRNHKDHQSIFEEILNLSEKQFQIQVFDF